MHSPAVFDHIPPLPLPPQSLSIGLAALIGGGDAWTRDLRRHSGCRSVHSVGSLVVGSGLLVEDAATDRHENPRMPTRRIRTECLL